MCKFFEGSRSGYYEYVNRIGQLEHDADLAEKIRDDGKEFVTIYYGEDIAEKHAQKAADLFAEVCPDADVTLLSGGQPVYYYMISAE